MVPDVKPPYCICAHGKNILARAIADYERNPRTSIFSHYMARIHIILVPTIRGAQFKP